MPAQLKPPIGLPTASSTAEEQEWSSLISTQLADVRKTAENWRNGLVTIIGLITAFSLIKGPGDLGGLNPWAKWAVGALLLLALLGAIFGAWKSLIAAYGTPSVITREDFSRFGGINGYRLDLARKAASSLHFAQGATLATLLLLAGAVGLTWYGPRSISLILHVERNSLPNVCGRLVSSENGHMDIKPSASAPVRVYMKDIVKVSAVEECP